MTAQHLGWLRYGARPGCGCCLDVTVWYVRGFVLECWVCGATWTPEGMRLSFELRPAQAMAGG